MKNGNLVISLDFELIWGLFDVLDGSEKEQYFLNTKKIIPKILSVFEDNGIHATWATVGMLFNNNWKEWEENCPKIVPRYTNSSLSAYAFADKMKGKLNCSNFFAADVIAQIKKTQGQEIGTHTYSHYYCLESGQTAVEFEKDLETAVKVASDCGIVLKSLIFPRNQLKKEYLEICYNHGIENVRSNPDVWYWKDVASESVWKKLARSGDAYLPLGKKTYSSNLLQRRNNAPLEQRASRFYRPLESNFLRRLKILRIKMEMREAAKNKEIYHLWWHPHNFGESPDESLKDLKEIIAQYGILEKEYNFKSLNMAELGNLLK